MCIIGACRGGEEMQTRVVPQSQWRAVFDSLSRVYEGSSATLEILDPDLGDQFEIEDQPFRGISSDASGIELNFMTKDGRHLVHIISRPKQVQIEEGDDGLVAALLFEAEDGPRNVLRLHSPVPSKLLPAASE
jgi:hypothetical protein